MEATYTPPVTPFPAGEVFGKIKNFRTEFIDLTGKSRRGEYWATFVCLVLPISIITGLFTLILFFVPFVNIVASPLSSIFGAITTLIMFPVMARRMHDIGLTGWIATGISVVSVIACMVPILSWVTSFVAFVALIVFGCIPGKADAPASTDKAKTLGVATVSAVAGLTALNILVYILVLVIIALCFAS